MGEIADMMLEGNLCEGCGIALEGNGHGIPRYCSDECARDRGYDGINADGSGRYGKRKAKQSNHFPKDVLSIKITYKGQKIYYATQNDSTFENAADIAQYLNKYLTQALGIQPRFTHPKAGVENEKN